MKRVISSGAMLIASALAISACHPVRVRHAADNPTHGSLFTKDDDAPVSVGTSLTCPEHLADLDRTSASGDGRSCGYSGPDGRKVTLSLMALNDQPPQAALGATETALRAMVPVSATAGNSLVSVDAHDGDGEHRAKIDLPFLHIDANGDKADVKVFGADIKADGQTETADIHSGGGNQGAVIHAGPGGAEIRAGDVGRRTASLVFILAGDKPGPEGYRTVGYVAKGPAAGPLVVAEFQSKNGRRDGNEDDLQQLIDLNVSKAAS